MSLTRREKHALIVCALIALVFIIFKPDQSTTELIEYFGLFLVVAPMGFYIAADPERKKKDGNS